MFPLKYTLTRCQFFHHSSSDGLYTAQFLKLNVYKSQCPRSTKTHGSQNDTQGPRIQLRAQHLPGKLKVQSSILCTKKQTEKQNDTKSLY